MNQSFYQYHYRTRLYKNISIFYLIFVFSGCYYLDNYHPIEVSVELQKWAMAHIVLHSLPIYLYLRNFTKQPTNFPFIQTLSFFNIFHFGLPVYFIKLPDFQLGILDPRALEIAFYAYLLFYSAYYIFKEFLRTKPLEFIPVQTPILHLKYFSYTLLGIYILSMFVDESSIHHLGNVGFYIYIGFNINFWKERLLSYLEKAIFVPILLYDIILRSLGGLLAPLALLLFFIMLCVIITNSRKIFILGGVIFFTWFYSIFSVIKFDFRTTVWYGSKDYSIIDRVQLVEDLYNENKQENAVEYVDKYKGKEQFLWRYSYQLSALSMVINKTPATVPFWNGESYIPLFTKFIPRAFWQDKPTEQMGQLFGVRFGVISKYNTRTSINSPVIPELYFNFGYTGIYLGCLLLGIFYAFLTLYFNSNTVTYSSKIIGMAIIFPLVIWESNFSLIFGNLILVSFFLIILFKLIISFIKH